MRFMWYFHEDHHQPKYANIFERNDIFFCDFCYSEYVPFSVGAEAGFNYLFFIGLGIIWLLLLHDS
jgi:beta-carotene 3-hydroxylase